MSEISVTLARESEAPACLALLPKIVGTQAELLIARRDGEFAGAGAVIWINLLDPPGFHVLVRVLHPARRHGVGRALIEAAADLADGETDGLWSLDAVPPESPAAKFLESCGFTPRRREYHCVIENERLLANVVALVDRYRSRGRIPAQAEIRRLADPAAPLDEIAWLVAREFNGNAFTNLQNLFRRREAAADRSLYVWLDGEVLAVMLIRVQDGSAVVDAWVVAPRWRNGFASLVLLENALARAKAESCTYARFFCDENVIDTINLVRRAGGDEMDIQARYHLAFQ